MVLSPETGQHRAGSCSAVAPAPDGVEATDHHLFAAEHDASAREEHDMSRSLSARPCAGTCVPRWDRTAGRPSQAAAARDIRLLRHLFRPSDREGEAAC